MLHHLGFHIIILINEKTKFRPSSQKYRKVSQLKWHCQFTIIFSTHEIETHLSRRGVRIMAFITFNFRIDCFLFIIVGFNQKLFINNENWVIDRQFEYLYNCWCWRWEWLCWFLFIFSLIFEMGILETRW